MVDLASAHQGQLSSPLLYSLVRWAVQPYNVGLLAILDAWACVGYLGT